ncbi:MAG: diguanylate cyclase [Magnetococcales bacterium]|nr:diguanylate cyclase [Magnetococcales bacterium]
MENTTSQQRILIVDDIPANIALLAEILRGQYAISAAINGSIALEIASSEHPDLILLDIMMPGMDGFEVCTRLKGNEKTKDILVIFITALDAEVDEIKGFDLGAVDFISKPFSRAVIQARVRNHLSRRLVEQSISRLHHEHRLILDAAGEGIFGLDLDGKTRFINQAGAKILGWNQEELLGKPMHDTIHGKRKDGSPNPIEECPICATLKDGMTRHSGDDVFWRKDGTFFSVRFTSTPLCEAGQVRGTVAVFQDITQLKLLEKNEIQSQASRIAISALLETSLEPLSLDRQLDVALEIVMTVPWLSIERKGSIFIVDETNGDLILRASKGLAPPLLALCARLSMGQCLCGQAAKTRKTIFSNKLDENHTVRFAGIHNHGHYCVPIIFQKRLQGILNCYIPADLPYSPEEEAFLMTIANTLAGIIERRKLEKKLEEVHQQLAFAALHDDLTGLPNRVLFKERLVQGISLAVREKTVIGLLFFDLDWFKQVNDTLGHDVGDKLLLSVGNRVTSLLRKSDTLARLGGDEFAIILGKISGEEDAVIVAQKLIDMLSEPFQLGPHECRIGSSVGIALFPFHATDPETLIMYADSAMYVVKQKGRNSYSVFSASECHKEIP